MDYDTEAERLKQLQLKIVNDMQRLEAQKQELNNQGQELMKEALRLEGEARILRKFKGEENVPEVSKKKDTT